ncbi:hypothetical protein [Streptomyces sp. NPDC057299]|uniref:hypothetical protein n=1 Tax=unclassified Streptomyces TaxID=2593676 RepID=UPI00363F9ACD
MTDYFCIQCAEARLGPAAAKEARLSAAAAPRFTHEQAAFLGALFRSAQALRVGGGTARRCQTCQPEPSA